MRAYKGGYRKNTCNCQIVTELQSQTNSATLHLWNLINLFYPFNILCFGRVDAYFLAFLNEWRDGERDAIFERRRLVRIGCGSAFQVRVSPRNYQLQRSLKLKADQRS